MRVYVRMQDEKGEPIRDFRKEEMVVFLDKQELPVLEVLAGSTEPLTLGLVVDVSGSRRNELPGGEIPPAIELVRNLITPENKGFVITFKDKPQLVSKPTNDISQLMRAIEEGGFRYSGPTAFYDALVEGSKLPAAQQTSRRALVSVSDCIDNSSRLTPEDTLKDLLRNGFAVWVIQLYDSDDQRGMLRGAKVCKELSERTGGRLLRAQSKKELAQDFDAILKDLRGQYAVTLDISSLPRDGKFHALHYQSSRQGLEIFGPAGLYAPKKKK